MQIELKKLTCNQCGHTWPPRTTDVRACPKCRSVLWDRPKKKGNMSEEAG